MPFSFRRRRESNNSTSSSRPPSLTHTQSHTSTTSAASYSSQHSNTSTSSVASLNISAPKLVRRAGSMPAVFTLPNLSGLLEEEGMDDEEVKRQEEKKVKMREAYLRGARFVGERAEAGNSCKNGNAFGQMNEAMQSRVDIRPLSQVSADGAKFEVYRDPVDQDNSKEFSVDITHSDTAQKTSNQMSTSTASTLAYEPGLIDTLSKDVDNYANSNAAHPASTTPNARRLANISGPTPALPTAHLLPSPEFREKLRHNADLVRLEIEIEREMRNWSKEAWEATKGAWAKEEDEKGKGKENIYVGGPEKKREARKLVKKGSRVPLGKKK